MKSRVLVFDDDNNLRNLIVEILEEIGYEVLSFQNPSKIGKKLQLEYSKTDDIVITDIEMPIMNGIEFIKKLIKVNFKTENIAIMSGNWTESSLDFANHFGIKILKKPFSLNDLMFWCKKCENQTKSNYFIKSKFEQN